MRGQAYTLEAVVAALLIVSSLVFALQVTAVTPLSASTSSQHIENQQRASAAGALAAAAHTPVEGESNALREAVLYCNVTQMPGYHDADSPPSYTNRNPDNAFGEILDRSFQRGVALNVRVHADEAGDTHRMIDRGTPSDNAVSASRTVTIYENDTLTSPEAGGMSVIEASEQGLLEDCLPDSTVDDGPVYAVVRVEVTAWRM